MPILDFKEISKAYMGSGEQDSFELFSRDFLQYLGYKINTNVNRGADAGRDIIVEEKRTGIGGETTIHWLVSCKHNAHSGKSVTPSDESNIRDRVDTHHCKGFIGMYSTLPSSGLNTTVEGLKSTIEIQLFDHEKIEHELLASPSGLKIAERYFPKSFKKLKSEDKSPAKIFGEKPSLKCKYCGKELLGSQPSGIIVFWRDRTLEDKPDNYKDVYWCCKGICDKMLIPERLQLELIDGWEDISDVLIPQVYLKWVIALLNKLYRKEVYSQKAFDNLITFMISIFPYVSRSLTSDQKERFESILMMPSFLGGFNS
jgi:hypothetical protein